MENYIIYVDLDNMIPACIIGLVTRLGLEGILLSVIEDSKIKVPLGVDPEPNSEESLFFSKDNGEGSSKSQEVKKGGIIGPEDYTYDSESDYGGHNVTDEEKTDNRATGDNVTTFENKVDSMTNKGDVSSTKEEIEHALALYKSSGEKVPAFKQQVSELEKKLEICENKLVELENEEELESKTKGKEKETAKDTTSTKRSENPVDNPGPWPKRVPNPNFRPIPSSVESEWDDYYDNSDDEEQAIRRAIEESLKEAESSKRSNSPKEESSKSNKGKEREE
jgi:hypothetical protein